MSVDGKEASTAAALIPEFYYDLICRVLPGILLAVLFWWQPLGAPIPEWIVKLAKEEKIGAIPFTLLFVALVGVGYVLGILISPCGSWLRSLYQEQAWTRVRNDFPSIYDRIVSTYKECLAGSSGECGASAPKTGLTGEPRQPKARNLSALLDADLKARNAQAQVLLPKLNAEAALCENLVVPVLAWGIITFTLAANRGTCPWHVIGLTLVSVAVSGRVGWDMYLGFVRRQFSFFRIVYGP